MASSGKIGVLTFHRCINYGSYWQARCLVEGLRSAGHDAVLLDHHCDLVERAELRCAFQPRLPERSSRLDLGQYAAKVRSFLEAFKLLPMSQRFSLHRPESVDGYETIIIGSDEVWNLQHPWYGQKPIFYGAGLNADRLVSYAASFGSHSASEGLHPWWAGHLENFRSISVRDENSRGLVAEATGRDPHLVLDPCLQFPAAARLNPVAEERPYAVVYGHGFPDWFAADARRWADKEGVKLLSVGYRNDWADEQQLGASPMDFAGRMAGAQAVITNFFHGCVFALLNEKPFATTPTAYRFNKVRDLVAAVGAREHLVEEGRPAGFLAERLQQPLDREIGSRIARLRASSGSFLDTALAA